MYHRVAFIPLALLGSGFADPTSADTLFLVSGTTLKIETLSCDSRSCLATFPGGRAEVPASVVLRIEPDEDVESQSPPAPAGADEARASRVEPGAGARDIEALIAEAARRYALPRSLVRAVARNESGLNPGAVSPKGARGVMQLMPDTARELGVTDAFDPAQNIDAGARLLRAHLERFGGRLAEALAAYNAGLGAVARHQGVPPYSETRRYIRRIVKDLDEAASNPVAGAREKKEP